MRQTSNTIVPREAAPGYTSLGNLCVSARTCRTWSIQRRCVSERGFPLLCHQQRHMGQEARPGSAGPALFVHLL